MTTQGEKILRAPPVRPDSFAPGKSNTAWSRIWGLIIALAAVGALISTFAHPDHIGFFTRAVGIAVVITAAIYDSATARIPNALTYPAILIGLALSLLTFGAMKGHSVVTLNWLGYSSNSPMLESLWGFGACAVIGVVAVLFNGIHAGDMKLIAAMGAIFGLHDVAVMLLWGLIVAIPMAVVNLLIDRKLTLFFQFAGLQIMNWFWLRRHEPAFEVNSKWRIPIAFPLALGMILALLVPAHLLPTWLTGGLA